MIKEINNSELKTEFQLNRNDVGSAEVQIIDLTSKINYLSGHVKEHKKDHSSRLGLLKMVNRRRRFLRYLKSKKFDIYKNLINGLGLRR
jgi:small subunit ribosomal protein S15